MFNVNSEQLIISDSNVEVFLELSAKTVRDTLKRYLYLYVGILIEKIADESAEFVHLGNNFEIHEIKRIEDGQKVFDEEFSQDIETSVFIEDMVLGGNIIILSVLKLIDKDEEEKRLVSIHEIGELNIEDKSIYVQKKEISLGVDENHFNLKVPTSVNRSGLGGSLWEEFGNYRVDPNDLFAHLGVALNNLGADIVDLYPRIKRFAIVSPTGSGKTSMEARITKVALKYFSVVVVSPYIGLLMQNSMEFGIPNSAYLYGGEKTPIHRDMQNSVIFTTINSLPTLISKLNDAEKDYMLILDEVHFFLQSRAYLLDLFAEKLTIGFTGTDGRSRRLSDLGFHYSHYSLLQEGIASGYLAPVRIYRYISRVSEYTSGILKRYEEENALFDEEAIYRFAKDDIYAKSIAHAFVNHSIIFSESGEVIGVRPTVIEACSIMQASEIIFPLTQSLLPDSLKSKVGIFVSDNEVTGKVSEFLEKLKHGVIDIVIHVNMLGVGINVPRLEVIFLRPRIRSETKTEQSIGRVIRTFSNTIKTVVEIFPETRYSPEDMGFVTANQIFGIKILLNGLVFRGDVAQYERQAKVVRLQEYFKRKHRFHSNLKLNGAPCILVDEHFIHKDEGKGGIKLGAINSVERLSDFFSERILSFQVFQLKSVFSFNQVITGETVIPIIPQKSFERIFGFQKHDCARKFFGGDIASIDQFIYNLCRLNENILNPYQSLESFSSFIEFVDTNITSNFGLDLVFENLYDYFSAPIIRKYCELWISKGQLHPDYLSRNEQTKIQEILRLKHEMKRLKFPFAFPSIDFSAPPHQIILDIEESIVAYMTREYLSAGGNKMVRSLPVGYYFRDFDGGTEKLFKFVNWVYKNTSTVRFEKLQQQYYQDSRVFLRELHRKVSSRCGEESWMDKPVDLEYLKKMVIKNYQEGKKTLKEISDISNTVFNYTLKQFGLSAIEYINNCLATVDEDFAVSNRIYQNENYENFLSSLEQWAKASSKWRGKNIALITTTNLHEFLPPICSVSSKSTEVKSLTRAKIKELAKRFQVKESKLISDVREVLWRVGSR